MTDIIKMFSGIGVIIDDEINVTGSSIKKVVSSFDENHIPYLSYEELPSVESLQNLHSVSFVLLDWKWKSEASDEMLLKENIAFIMELHKVCFVPVFIFTDEDPHSIISQIEDSNFLEVKKTNLIFAKHKSELDTSEKLFSAIKEWIKNTPSVYVLKEWEKVNRDAKKEMFWALVDAHPSWPKILMDTIKKDGGDQQIELIEMLQNNLNYRVACPNLDTNLIKQQNTDGITKEDLRKILECERFIPIESLPRHPFAGDVYIIDEKYYLNIRPDCDIIRDADKDNKDMYLLEGEIVDETKINADDKDHIIFDSGEFIEKKNCCFIAFIRGKIMQFRLRELNILKWNDIKEKRIGRLLPPYITRVQQKYAHYIQRQGLPSIPKQAIIVENKA